MSFNAVAMLLFLVAATARTAPDGLHLTFPFKTPIAALMHEPGELATQEGYDHYCYRFVYATVRLLTHEVGHGSFADKLAALCHDQKALAHGSSRCRSWSHDLEKAVEEKKEKEGVRRPEGPNSPSYEKWCDEVYEDMTGTKVQRKTDALRAKLHEQLLTGAAPEAPIAHKAARAKLATPVSHDAFGNKSAVASSRPAMGTAAKKAETPQPSKAQARLRVNHTTTEERATKRATAITKVGAWNLLRANSEDVAARPVAPAETNLHTLGNAMNAWKGVKIAEEISSSNKDVDVDGALDKLSSALRSAHKLNTMK